MLDYMTVAEDREKARKNLDRALAGEHLLESAFSGEEPGPRRYFEVSHHPVRASDGPVIGVAVFANDVTERQRAEEDRLAHLRFFERLDQINRALHGTNDLEQMMSDVLDAALDVFDCDRAWLVYPCDPESASYRVPMERTRPDSRAPSPEGSTCPSIRRSPGVLRAVRASDGPVTFGPGSELPLPTQLTERFGVQSQIAVAVYPKVFKPYVFGLHQCSRRRIWTPEDAKLLRETGRRLGDALTSLLTHRGLTESEERYRTLIQRIQAAVVVHGPDTRVLASNSKAQELLGLSEDQLLGRTVTDRVWQFSGADGTAIPPEEFPACKVCATGQALRDRVARIHRPGEDATGDIWVLVNADPVLGRDGEVLQVIVTFTDITELKRLETEQTRASRALRLLSDANQALIRITDEAALLNEVCRIAVDVGGYRLAWVGFAEHDEANTLRSVAQAGPGSGDIEPAGDVRTDEERGRGPSGDAVRTGRSCIVRSTAEGPGFDSWREAAARRDYRSAIALPLASEGRTFGALVVYAGEEGAFDAREVEVLEELAGNLAFGVTALRTGRSGIRRNGGGVPVRRVQSKPRRGDEVAEGRLHKEAERGSLLLDLFLRSPQLSEKQVFDERARAGRPAHRQHDRLPAPRLRRPEDRQPDDLEQSRARELLGGLRHALPDRQGRQLGRLRPARTAGDLQRLRRLAQPERPAAGSCAAAAVHERAGPRGRHRQDHLRRWEQGRGVRRRRRLPGPADRQRAAEAHQAAARRRAGRVPRPALSHGLGDEPGHRAGEEPRPPVRGGLPDRRRARRVRHGVGRPGRRAWRHRATGRGCGTSRRATSTSWTSGSTHPRPSCGPRPGRSSRTARSSWTTPRPTRASRRGGRRRRSADSAPARRSRCAPTASCAACSRSTRARPGCSTARSRPSWASSPPTSASRSVPSRRTSCRTRAEQALRAERGLFVGGPTVVFNWKAEEGWPVEYVSPNVADQFGYAPEDFTSGRVLYRRHRASGRPRARGRRGVRLQRAGRDFVRAGVPHRPHRRALPLDPRLHNRSQEDGTGPSPTTTGTSWTSPSASRRRREVVHVNRALRMLSDTNQALIRVTDEATLLNEVCRIAVDVGGYRMAWVGTRRARRDQRGRCARWPRRRSARSHVESASGHAGRTTSAVEGPAGPRSAPGQPCIVRSISADPDFAPWREAACSEATSPSSPCPSRAKARPRSARHLRRGGGRVRFPGGRDPEGAGRRPGFRRHRAAHAGEAGPGGSGPGGSSTRRCARARSGTASSPRTPRTRSPSSTSTSVSRTSARRS